MTSGIYSIKQKSLGRVVYVGSSQYTRDRIGNHKWMLNNHAHNNPYLQSVWDKYGEGDFEFSIVEEVDKSNLVEREQFWLDTLRPLCTLAVPADTPSGWGHSAASKERISKANRGKIVSEETRQRMSEANRLRWQDPNHIPPPSPFLPGNKVWLGKKHSEETRRKMSETRKKIWQDPEFRENTLPHISTIGKNKSPETIEKIRQAALRRNKSVKDG